MKNENKQPVMKDGNEVAKMGEQMGAKINNPAGADFHEGHKKLTVSKEVFQATGKALGVIKKSK